MVRSLGLVKSAVTLEDLFPSTEKLLFLAGSGISIAPPSNIPSGFQITSTLIEKLIPPDQVPEITPFTDPFRSMKREENDFIRFEQLMGYAKTAGLDVDILRMIAAGKAPNHNHLFLAHALTMGHSVATTNFDSLIEYALLEIGIPREKVFPLVKWYEWKFAKDEDEHFLLKLHGSVFDVRSEQEVLESVQANLHDISRGKIGVFELPSWQRSRLEPLLQQLPIVVMGYSGLDDFDIIPALLSCRSDRKLLWIDHAHGVPLEQVEIEEVVEVEDDPAARSRLDRLLLQFVRLQARERTCVFRIQVDTAELIGWLWKRYLKTAIPAPTKGQKGERTAFVERSVPEDTQWFIAGNLYCDLNFPDKAIHCFEQVLRLSPDSKHKGWSLERIVYAQHLHHSPDLEKSQEAMVAGLNWAAENAEVALSAALRLQLGKVIGKSFPEEGLRLLEETFNFYENESDQLGKSLSSLYIGVCLKAQGKFQSALPKFQLALKFAEMAGELRSKALILYEIGALQADTEDLEASARSFEESYRIFSMIGDIYNTGLALNGLGISLRKLGRYQEAIESYEKYYTLGKELGIARLQATALNNLGLVSRKVGRLAESLEYHRQALQIYREIDDKDGQATSHVNIGTLHFSEQDYARTLAEYRTALKLYKELNDRSKILFLEKNIDHVQSKMS